MVPKSSQHSAEFPIVCLILYGWIQSTAMFKQKDVRWYGFQWSTLISIDYVWSVYIHGAISTPWYSYCIWCSYIKNHQWWLAWWGKRSLMQDCSEKLFYTVIIYIYIYIYISMVGENVKILRIVEKLYMYIYYPSNLLIFLLNNYIIP